MDRFLRVTFDRDVAALLRACCQKQAQIVFEQGIDLAGRHYMYAHLPFVDLYLFIYLLFVGMCHLSALFLGGLLGPILLLSLDLI